MSLVLQLDVVLLLCVVEQLFRYFVLRMNMSVSERVAGFDMHLDVVFRENPSSATYGTTMLLSLLLGSLSGVPV